MRNALEANGLDIVELSQATLDRLRPLFPAEASIRNPLDMIASATPAGYAAAPFSSLRSHSWPRNCASALKLAACCWLA